MHHMPLAVESCWIKSTCWERSGQARKLLIALRVCDIDVVTQVLKVLSSSQWLAHCLLYFEPGFGLLHFKVSVHYFCMQLCEA